VSAVLTASLWSSWVYFVDGGEKPQTRLSDMFHDHKGEGDSLQESDVPRYANILSAPFCRVTGVSGENQSGEVIVKV
jgi:hypothetical protein